MEFTYLRSLFQQSALFLRPYLMRLILLSLPRKRFQSFQWFPPRQWSKLLQKHQIKSRFPYFKGKCINAEFYIQSLRYFVNYVAKHYAVRITLSLNITLHYITLHYINVLLICNILFHNIEITNFVLGNGIHYLHSLFQHVGVVSPTVLMRLILLTLPKKYVPATIMY